MYDMTLQIMQKYVDEELKKINKELQSVSTIGIEKNPLDIQRISNDAEVEEIIDD